MRYNVIRKFHAISQGAFYSKRHNRALDLYWLTNSPIQSLNKKFTLLNKSAKLTQQKIGVF